MRKYLTLFLMILVVGCTSLTQEEKNAIDDLSRVRITVKRPVSNWKPPVDLKKARLLSFLPGMGNFYLANKGVVGKEHYVYGALNLITWPTSIIWSFPTISHTVDVVNKKDLVYYYTYDPEGVNLLHYNGYHLTPEGYLQRIYRRVYHYTNDSIAEYW